jgi:hypothetical protein
VARVKEKDVSVGEGARAWCRRLGVPVSDIRAARVSGAETAGTEFITVYSSLPVGRMVRLKCPHDRRGFVQSWRLIPGD